jgi:hypothetical protein
VLAVLRDRGIPAPALEDLRRGLERADEQRLDQLRTLIQRLHSGADQGSDMDDAATWVSELGHAEPPRTRSASLPAANDSAPAAGAPPRIDAGRKWEPSHHVYAAKAALTVEPTTIQAVEAAREAPVHTLMIEMAEATRKNAYDWERKISFRLTKRELPLFTAWLFGWCPHAEFAGHGSANNKVLLLEDQGANLFIRLKQGRRLLAMPIGGEELADIAALAVKAMQGNAPHLESQTVLQIAKRCGALYARAVGSAPTGA